VKPRTSVDYLPASGRGCLADARARPGRGARAAQWQGRLAERQQVAPAQWRADIPVKEEYGPNVTFSVLYLANGDYVFQNKGLRVAVPVVDIAIRTPRERYAPGETVTLELETRTGAGPTPALVNLGVVDEMIYVLQPEIAPSIGNFFYHPRRNNVRTTVSLSFIGYDLARLPAKSGAPVRRSPSERGVKVLERPATRRYRYRRLVAQPDDRRERQGQRQLPHARRIDPLAHHRARDYRGRRGRPTDAARRIAQGFLRQVDRSGELPRRRPAGRHPRRLQPDRRRGQGATQCQWRWPGRTSRVDAAPGSEQHPAADRQARCG
jgi:hypothetical protein